MLAMATSSKAMICVATRLAVLLAIAKQIPWYDLLNQPADFRRGTLSDSKSDNMSGWRRSASASGSG